MGRVSGLWALLLPVSLPSFPLLRTRVREGHRLFSRRSIFMLSFEQQPEGSVGSWITFALCYPLFTSRIS